LEECNGILMKLGEIGKWIIKEKAYAYGGS
jgi:hypothetical protein